MARSLDERLEQTIRAAREARRAIASREKPRSLLSTAKHRGSAAFALEHAKRRLARLTRAIAQLRQAVERRDARRRAAMRPSAAICDVFGRYCKEAISVAWCESRLQPTAANGQYLGLFQMGSRARRLFGHGPTAHEQAAAAHRYFVVSGRDWSPWSCRWAA